MQGAPPAFCAIVEWCVPAFVGPDEMGAVGDDIHTMVD